MLRFDTLVYNIHLPWLSPTTSVIIWFSPNEQPRLIPPIKIIITTVTPFLKPSHIYLYLLYRSNTAPISHNFVASHASPSQLARATGSPSSDITFHSQPRILISLERDLIYDSMNHYNYSLTHFLPRLSLSLSLGILNNESTTEMRHQGQAKWQKVY